MFTPFDFPLCLTFPSRLSISPRSAWIEHIPFAFSLVQMLQPKSIVELGVQFGDSYMAFCQAVKTLGLNSRCYGVDHWQGDPHALSCGPVELASLRDYNDAHYGSFSRLVQSSFDEAAGSFCDGCIDLLHIDGYHTYDASHHDFETWRPKLSSRAVVLFHDTNVHERDFGVWRLWQELSALFPHFEFLHGNGLGVLAFGPDAPEAVFNLAKLPGTDANTVRDFYFSLGHGLELAVSARSFQAELLKTQTESLKIQTELAKTQADHSACRLELLDYQNRLSIVKNSRFWRLREKLAATPGLKLVFNRLS